MQSVGLNTPFSTLSKISANQFERIGKTTVLSLEAVITKAFPLSTVLNKFQLVSFSHNIYLWTLIF